MLGAVRLLHERAGVAHQNADATIPGTDPVEGEGSLLVAQLVQQPARILEIALIDRHGAAP
jgi:hypothetical protein